MKKTLALLFALAACGDGARAPAPVTAATPTVVSSPVPTKEAAPAKREPVVVAIIVDQFAAWIAAERLPLLPPGGGLARLVKEGTWAKRVVYPYAITDTAPGHAALHTGRVPSVTGLFANELPDPTSTRRASIMRDPETKFVTADGVTKVAGASAARLRVATVADRLRAARPDALVISVSIKDRGAILPAGQKPSHVIWYDSWENAWGTSTAFAEKLPSWMPFAKPKLPLDPWTPIDAAWIEAHSATKDDEPWEGNLDGFGTTFPHVAKSPVTYRASPASDRDITAIALAGVKAEWDPAKPTLILLSMSAFDVIGHTLGPDSWESWDELRHLDVTLGEFFDALEKHVGGSVGVVLAADHGDIPAPEAVKPREMYCKPNAPPDPWDRGCGGGERLSPTALTVELREAAAKAIGPGSFVAGLADPYLFLTDAARALPTAKLDALDRAMRATLMKHRGVLKVLASKELGMQCPDALEKAGDDILTLVCRAWPPGRPVVTEAGDYYVLTKKHSYFDAEYVIGKGTSHGTPYIYDRTIPLLVRAPGRADAGAVIEDPIEFVAYSEIEASLLGLESRSPKEILTARRRSSAPGSP